MAAGPAFDKLTYQFRAAPARQAQVFERVRQLAGAHASAFPGFPDIVEATYHSMVAGFVAAEGQPFNDTESISS